MEELIGKSAQRVKIFFYLFWIVPILFIVVGETGVTWVGSLADDVRVTYIAETTSILLTALCIPVSLKLFAWVLARKIAFMPLPKALVQYVWWSVVRLLLLALPLLFGLGTYYLTFSNTGALCALIAITASLFCVPGEQRMRKELNIDKETEA